METESEPYVRLATLRQLHRVVADLNTARSLADTLQTVVDGIVTGLNFSYSDTIRPALQIIGIRPGARKICGMYLMMHKDGMLFFGDTTVNLEFDAGTLADVAEMVADAAATFGVQPRVAMLSFSNFGSVRDLRSTMVADATSILSKRRPDLEETS